MKKKSEQWQEDAAKAAAEGNEGAQRYAERRAQAARQKEDAEQDRLEKFWRKLGGR